MTALREVAGLDITVNNKVSEGAAAAARDLEKVEAAADRAAVALKEAETGTRLAGDTFDRTAARSDGLARAEQRRAEIMARATREIEALTAAAAREGRGADELARAIQAVTLRRDADIARAQRQAEVQRAQQLALVGGASAQTQAMAGGAQAMAQYVAANDNAARSSGNLRMALGQVGFQVQDVATQISMGQNALMAFGVQGAQLAGFFGPTGAIAGAGLMLGVIAAQLLGVADNQRGVNQALERADGFYRSVTEAAERYQRGIQTEADEVARLTERYRALDEQRRQYEMRQAEARRAELMGAAGGLTRDINTDLGRVQMEAVRQVQAEQEALFRARQTGTAPTYSAGDAREALAAIYQFRAEAEAAGRVSEDMLLRLQERFRQTASSGGFFAESLTDAVGGLDRFVPRAEELDRRLRPIEQVLAILSGQSLPALTGGLAGAGNAAATAAGQVASLVAQAQALAAAARENPAAGLNARIHRVQEDAEALARGGLERLEAVRGLRTEAERASNYAQEAESEYRQAQERAQRNAQDVEREVQENRSLWALRGQELARQESENTRREAEARKAAQDAARAGAAASRQAQQDDAREARETARVIQDIEKDRQALMERGQSTYAATRTEAEKYAERLGELRNQLAAGAIDQDTFNRAVAAADPAVKRAQETANGLENSLAGAMTRAFERGEDAGRSFLESIASGVKSLAATIASQLVFRMAVIPTVNAVGSAVGLGSNLLGMPNTPIGGITLGGIFGGGAPVASAAGSTSAAANQAGQSAGLFGLGRISGLSGIMSYGGLSNTGWTGIDSFLNTPAWGDGGLSQVGGSLGGPTYGNLLGGGLTTAAGLYGIYSGIQRGGIGGFTTAAGGALGAAAGLSTMTGIGASLLGGPAAPLIAAALAIIGSLLPGQKPSGKGQETAIDLVSSAETYRGLGGDRYSAGNREQSQAAAQSIAALAGQLSNALGGLKIYTDAAVGVTSSRGEGPGQLYLRVGDQRNQFENTEEGAKALADQASKFLLAEFRKAAQGDYLGILNASPDVETLQQNLDWYENTWKSFQTGASAANAYKQAQDQINASYQTNIDKANQLSLATDAITAARDKELQKLADERDSTLRGYQTGLRIRQLQATGGDDPALIQQATLMQFDEAARQQIDQAKAQLESLGLSAEEVASNLVYNEAVLADERLKIQKDYAAQVLGITEQTARTAAEQARLQQQQMEQAAQSATSVISSLADYARGLSYSDKSALSVQDQYALATRQFNAVSGAVLAGDAGSLSKLQSYIDPYLAASRAMNGSGAAYVADFTRVTDVLSRVGNLAPDTLTASFQTQLVQTQTATLVAAIEALRAEVASLRTAQMQEANRPARAA